jgi:hypothetical protein
MAGTLEETLQVHCDGDFKANMPSVTGRKALAQRLKILLTTRRGRVPFTSWKNRGIDLRAYVLSKRPAGELGIAAKFEIEKDEQVERADVQAAISDGGRTVQLAIRIVEKTSETIFAFTMTIDEAAATLIELEKAA